MIGRLLPGVTIDQAQADLTMLATPTGAGTNWTLDCRRGLRSMRLAR